MMVVAMKNGDIGGGHSGGSNDGDGSGGGDGGFSSGSDSGGGLNEFDQDQMVYK